MVVTSIPVQTSLPLFMCEQASQQGTVGHRRSVVERAPTGLVRGNELVLHAADGQH